jgi:hypothetical protein
MVTLTAILTLTLVAAQTALAHWIRPPKPVDRMRLVQRERWLNRSWAHYAYVARHGHGRAARSNRRAERWAHRELVRVLALERMRTRLDPRRAICAVFHPCDKALQVAWCESRFSIYARNGQYLGLFQFGEYARSTYGFGWTALAQARAAHAYYMDAGWAPWECA